MKIYREGKWFELTDSELLLAWSEQTAQYHRQEIRNLMDMYCTNMPKCEFDLLYANDDAIDKIAKIYYKYYERREDGDYEYDTIHNAIEAYGKIHVYQPRLEVVDDCCTVDCWQDWGCFDNDFEARKAADDLWKDVCAGKYNDRLTPWGEGHHLNVCIELIRVQDWWIEDIYYDRDEEE